MARKRKYVSKYEKDELARKEQLRAARLTPISLDECSGSFNPWSHIFTYIGSDEFAFVAPVSKRWHALYRELEPVKGYHSRCTHPEPELVGLTSRKAAFASASRVQLAYELGMPMARPPVNIVRPGDEEDWCHCVIRHGAIEALQAALKLGMPLCVEMCEAAAKIGSLAKLRWLRSNGCPWDEDSSGDPDAYQAVSCTAAEAGHVEVLKFIKEQGVVFNAGTVGSGVCSMAVIEYFLSEGIDLQGRDSDGEPIATAAVAASAGDLAALQYARTHSFEWDDAAVGLGAAEGGSVEMLNWLADTLSLQWSPAELTAMLFRAGLHDKRTAAAWLLERGAVWPDFPRDEESNDEWQSGFVAWAKSNGYEE